MKKTITTTLLLSIFSAPLWAQTLIVDGYQEKLRDSIAGAPIGSLNRGARMQVVEQNGEWYKVRIEGWVRKGRLSMVQSANDAKTADMPAVNPARLLQPKLLKKGYSDEAQGQMIWLDVDFDTSQLPKPTRAIKGALVISDLFGDPMMRIYWTINDKLIPGETYSEKGTNFAYNEFLSHHQWVRFTEVEDMRASFEISDIIYEDGEQASWYR
jgi:hypothetical protein